MGRYVDWSDITGRYSDVARQAGAEGVASYWLPYAEAEVDARLALKYTTPFTPTAPALVKDLCIDLVYYKMTMRQKGSEVIKRSIDERFAGILNGTIVMADASASTLGQSLAWSEQSQSGYHTAFGPDDPINWAPSSSFMADVEDDRS